MHQLECLLFEGAGSFCLCLSNRIFFFDSNCCKKQEAVFVLIKSCLLSAMWWNFESKSMWSSCDRTIFVRDLRSWELAVRGDWSREFTNLSRWKISEKKFGQLLIFGQNCLPKRLYFKTAPRHVIFRSKKGHLETIPCLFISSLSISSSVALYPSLTTSVNGNDIKLSFCACSSVKALFPKYKWAPKRRPWKVLRETPGSEFGMWRGQNRKILQ